MKKEDKPFNKALKTKNKSLYGWVSTINNPKNNKEFNIKIIWKKYKKKKANNKILMKH